MTTEYSTYHSPFIKYNYYVMKGHTVSNVFSNVKE